MFREMPWVLDLYNRKLYRSWYDVDSARVATIQRLESIRARVEHMSGAHGPRMHLCSRSTWRSLQHMLDDKFVAERNLLKHQVEISRLREEHFKMIEVERRMQKIVKILVKRTNTQYFMDMTAVEALRLNDPCRLKWPMAYCPFFEPSSTTKMVWIGTQDGQSFLPTQAWGATLMPASHEWDPWQHLKKKQRYLEMKSGCNRSSFR